MRAYYGINRDCDAIYIVAATPDGPVKIGVSGDPEKRLVSLQTGSPHKLFLFGVYWIKGRAKAESVEARLLERFKGNLLTGEWIELPLREVCRSVEMLIRLFAGKHLKEWEHCFVDEVEDELMLKLHPELRFDDPNDPTPEELGVEHAAAQLGFGI